MRLTLIASIGFGVLAAVLSVACGSGGKVPLPPATIAPVFPGYLLFRADKDVDELFELYCVDGRTLSVVKLSESPANRGGIRMDGAQFSPNAAWVGYGADPDGDGVLDLYVVRPDGTGRRAVHTYSSTSQWGVWSSWYWAPDSSRLAWLVDDVVAHEIELYTAAPSGGASIKASGTLVSGGEVFDLRWSPDSSWIAYRADQDTVGVAELYVVRPDGTGPGKIHAPLGVMDNVGRYRWSPDSKWLAFQLRDDASDTTRLFVWSVTGGELPWEVSNGLVIGRNVELDFTWAPDSSRLAYRADRDLLDVGELYSVLPNGSGHVKLNPPLPAGRMVFIAPGSADIGWAPDSSQIAYVADQDIDNVAELFVAPSDASSPASKVNAPLVAGRRIWRFAWAPDSSRLAYQGDQDKVGVVELYTAIPGGTGSARVSASLPSWAGVPDSRWWDLVGGGGVGYMASWAWSPDSARLVYVANQDTSDIFEIYTTLADGSAMPTKVHGAMALGDDLGAPFWSPSGSHLVFGRMGPNPTLFVHRLGSTAGAQVCGALVPGGNVGSWEWSP